MRFATPYTITVGLPGSNPQSVLFVDQRSFAESVGASQPSTLPLLGSAMLGLGRFVRMRRS